jgi:hypothetical protein
MKNNLKMIMEQFVKLDEKIARSSKEVFDVLSSDSVELGERFKGLEKELQEKFAYHDKMVKYWESEKAKTHPVSKYREEIASEWRVSKGTIREVLGVEPKIKEEIEK